MKKYLLSAFVLVATPDYIHAEQWSDDSEIASAEAVAVANRSEIEETEVRNEMMPSEFVYILYWEIIKYYTADWNLQQIFSKIHKILYKFFEILKINIFT